MRRIAIIVSVLLILVTVSVALSTQPLFNYYGNTYYYNPIPGSYGVSTFFREGWVTVDDEKTGNIRICVTSYSEPGTFCTDGMNHVEFPVDTDHYYGLYQLTVGVIRYESRTYVPLIVK